jgi:hypothetical protein
MIKKFGMVEKCEIQMVTGQAGPQRMVMCGFRLITMEHIHHIGTFKNLVVNMNQNTLLTDGALISEITIYQRKRLNSDNKNSEI